MDNFQYCLFGINFISNRQFINYPLLEGNGQPEIKLDWKVGSNCWPESNLVYISPYKNFSGIPVLQVYPIESGWRLHFPDVADFLIFSNSIECYLVTEASSIQAEIYFVSLVITIWLELQGRPVLHASTVALNNFAVGMMTVSGGGKSTLAAYFLLQGASLLSDDLLGLHWANGQILVEPGYKAIRLLPEFSRQFLTDIEALPRVHPATEKRIKPVENSKWASFASSPCLLRRIYLLNRESNSSINGIKLETLSGQFALMTLHQHSFIPLLVEKLGLNNSRLEKLAELARLVPVRRLTYPNGLDGLQAAYEIVLKDVLE